MAKFFHLTVTAVLLISPSFAAFAKAAEVKTAVKKRAFNKSIVTSAPKGQQEEFPFKKLIAMNEFPATSFFVDVNETTLQVNVAHHFGARYAPLGTTGLITPSDLAQLLEKARVIQSLGDSYVFKFSVGRCEFPKEFRFECWQGEPTTLGTVKVTPFAFHSSFETHEGIDGTFEQVKITLSMLINEDLYSVAMPYQKSEVSITK